MTPTRSSPTHSPDRDASTTGRERRMLHDEAVTPLVLVASSSQVMRPTTGNPNPSALLALQRLRGNAHVARLVTGAIQRQPTKVISIGDEKVVVASDAEKTEAEQIFKEIREKYGVRMSSSSGITAIETDYDNVPESLQKQVKTTAWTMEELRALPRALAHFAPILGKERASSKRSGSKQELASLSKLEQGIDKNEKTAKFSKKLKAQQFDTLRNVTLYASLTEFPAGFKGDRVREIEGIIIHELAHGLLDYAVDDYLKNLPYWKDAKTKSGKAGVEAPITDYGTDNIDEDLGEAVRFYFLAPQKLKDGTGGKKMGEPGNPCKKRFELIDGYVKAWKRTPPAKQ